MKRKIDKLFDVFKNHLAKESSDEEIINILKSDEELIEASNHYCGQCGECCNSRCQNKEARNDGLVYCLLHDSEFPNGKSIPNYLDIYHRLDPSESNKPLVCHTYGPHLGFLSLIKRISLDSLTGSNGCVGASNMFRDYQKFLESH